MEEWRNGGMEEWRNGGMEEWRNGGMEEWRNGGMKVYSKHCAQNIILKTLLTTIKKQANLIAILQGIMFERGKFEVNDFCGNLPLTNT